MNVIFAARLRSCKVCTSALGLEHQWSGASGLLHSQNIFVAMVCHGYRALRPAQKLHGNIVHDAQAFQ